MSAQSGSKDKQESACSKATCSNSADDQLDENTQRDLESQNVQKPAGKLTPNVDEQTSDSNDGSTDETAGQSRFRMKASLYTFKGDAKERYRHTSPETVECEYRAEKKRETRAMDNKGRIAFQPRVTSSDFQTKRDDSLKQFEDFASETGSDDDKRHEKSFVNHICSVKVADEIGMPVPGNRYGLDVTWVHFRSVSEFPHNTRNLTPEQYV
jgi:hypothetical protein